MSLPRPTGHPDPDTAGARLRALRLVRDDTYPLPDTHPGEPEVDPEPVGVDWPDDAVWGGWVPAAGSSAPPERGQRSRPWSHEGPDDEPPARPRPPDGAPRRAGAVRAPDRSVWERALARLPLPLAGAAEQLGPLRSLAVAIVLAVAAAAGAGLLIGRHMAPVAGPPQSFPDLGGGAANSAAPGNSLAPGGTHDVAAGSALTGAGPIVVDVEGKVRHPGLVTLPAGARVADAIKAAGGLRGPVRDPSLDLAARVGDGQLLAVGRNGVSAGTGGPATGVAPEGSVGAGGAASDPTAGEAPGAPLNLNTATEAQLEALPGVGPVLAGRILAYVAQHGGFTAVSQLEDVPGIGPSHYSEIEPLVTT